MLGQLLLLELDYTAVFDRQPEVMLGFTDPFMVQKIEILTSDCATIGTFDQAFDVAFARDGQVIVIDPGPTAGLRREFPETGTLAATTDRCGTVSSP